MYQFMKLSLTAAAITAMFAAPPLALADDGQVSIKLNPVPVSLGKIVTITAVGSDFEDRLVRGEVDIRNAVDDKILDDARMTQIDSRTFSYAYTVPANEEAGRWEVKVKLYDDDEHDADEKVRMYVEEGSVTPPPPVCADNDGDGYTDATCGGTDCNDSNAAINPGASEICGDNIDQDCSGGDLLCVVEPPPVCADNDGDGYTDAACGGTDCNDSNAAINPGASEICGDSIDQDCSGGDLLCGVEPPPATGSHAALITSYDGPATCVACHQTSAYNMLDSLHMQWSGPTPDLTNTNGEPLGKAVNGINTFCTYAMSSGGACFGCHVRIDGNAPHTPDVNDVDCLMCHNDTYQRMTVADPATAETVVDYLGNEKTYVFGAQDVDGNYTNVPNFDAMPAGTTMLQLAQNVHLPTRTSCLRCHAKAGGGDWTKRGDMGLSTKAPGLTEDVHMSPAGADLSCSACHSTEGGHKVGGRGIDLRQTEAVAPTCQACHTTAPHNDATINRHAQGQVSCQVCHIRTFGKGGATEMSRDWLAPHWNPAFCNGQGGYVGHEVKVADVKPEYTWFDGTSYVYNVGEQISPNGDGTYTMAKANGDAFDGKSKIVPIKRHLTNMPLHESGQIIAPKIMRMFMTGDFDQAVQEGMADQGLTGNYTMVDADAEMLISHGVDPKANAPACAECHDGSGQTPDGSRMLPLGALGYQQFPSSSMCSLCHSSKSAGWESMHGTHVDSLNMDCASCHTAPPTGLTSAPSSLCSSCHGYENTTDFQSIHNRHLKKNIACATCHTF